MAVDDETIRLARKLRVTIDAQVDATVRDLVRAWARAWDEIHAAWADAMMDLAVASTDGRWPSLTLIARSERAQRALAVATEEIASLAEFAGVTITDRLGKVVTDTPEWQARIIASQLPAEAGTTAELVARFNRVDQQALGAIVERTTEQITASTYRLGSVAQDAMRRVLVRGIAVGDNPRKAAAEMVRRAEGTFNGGLTRALTIARTEMLDAHRSAAAASHFANENVLAGWQWLAQLDTRTCPSCWAQHGNRYDLDVMGPMDHQQGRCARLPITRTWRELGFDIDEPPSIIPDARAVFDGLPQADRLAIMGPARLQALDDGLIDLGDLSQRRSTSGWRDSFAPTPLRALPVG